MHGFLALLRNFKGSGSLEIRGVGIVANDRYCTRPMVIDVPVGVSRCR